MASAADIGRRTSSATTSPKPNGSCRNLSAKLDGWRAWLATVSHDVPLDALNQAVPELNRLSPEQARQHRNRMCSLWACRWPTQRCGSRSKVGWWSTSPPKRLGVPPDDLLPTAIGYGALGTAIAAYELWLCEEDAT